jgi:hypothetical protein
MNIQKNLFQLLILIYLFSKNELESMETVKNRLSSFSIDQIIEQSHDELGWSENKDRKDLISYQKYASLLRHF